MLYGIAVIVIAALVGLIVLNLRGGKPAKGPAARTTPEPVKPEPGRGLKPEKPSAGEARQDAAAKSAEPEPAAAVERNVPKEPDRPAEVVHAAGAPAAAAKLTGRRLEAEEAPLPPRSRRSGTTSLNWEQSDEEYRKALRGFAGTPAAASRTADEGGAAAEPPSGVDDAYREGLRSLRRPE
ncbi:hypothetical protein ACFFK0_29675 [Paenibacillus chartarius]|uniref:Uncharacterized protein n=1 Tax=Paenibacillus chartarius TaxID=747481 RepID=A0ABV6DV84_9BACL